MVEVGVDDRGRAESEVSMVSSSCRDKKRFELVKAEVLNMVLDSVFVEKHLQHIHENLFDLFDKIS